MTLNNYITHPNEAVPTGLRAHRDAPLGPTRSLLWGPTASSCTDVYHNYCKVGNHKCYG